MTGSTLRRTPQQQRSRERVEAILAAAHVLIVESGSDALRMTDVATRAGVPIGSVYQYFPDKPAILRELVLRLMSRTRDGVRGGLVGVSGKADAIERIDLLLAGYYELFVTEPDMRDIWASTQSDRDLQQLDVEDSRLNGALIADALGPFVPPDELARFRDVCFLFAHLAGSTARLAIAAGDSDGRRLVDELRAVVRTHLEALLTD